MNSSQQHLVLIIQVIMSSQSHLLNGTSRAIALGLATDSAANGTETVQTVGATQTTGLKYGHISKVSIMPSREKKQNSMKKFLHCFNQIQYPDSISTQGLKYSSTISHIFMLESLVCLWQLMQRPTTTGNQVHHFF